MVKRILIHEKYHKNHENLNTFVLKKLKMTVNCQHVLSKICTAHARKLACNFDITHRAIWSVGTTGLERVQQLQHHCM
jgi:hypothetical protein